MDYSKLVRLILPEAIDGVLKYPRISHFRLVEKLQELEFVTRNISVTAAEVAIELQVIDDQLLYQLLSGEANKFLLASLVSYDRAFQMQHNNVAWQAVEHYYAAYYAIHYLLRITGVSLTNLDATAASTIIRNQLGSSTVSNVPTGLYTITYNDPAKTLYLKKKLTRGPGGSHLDAWQLWEELIGKLQKNASADPVEYASVSVDLSKHKSFIIKSTGRYTPPEVRGEINYQFKGGTWIFEKDATKSIRRLQAAISESTSMVTSTSANPETLVSNNKIIIHLAKKFFLHSSEKYPKSICRSIKNKFESYMGGVA